MRSVLNIDPTGPDSDAGSVPAGRTDALKNQLPFPFPKTPGAYVVIGCRWAPLPGNNGHLVQTYADTVTLKLLNEELEEEAIAGKPSNLFTVEIGKLTFDGRERVPICPAKDFVLVYVGTLPVRPAKYPLLRTYPAIEIAPIESASVGARTTPLYLIAPGFPGFALKRLAVTIEHPKPDLTVLRPSTTIAPGYYAIRCGEQAYEVILE